MLVFCNKRARVEHLGQALRERGIANVALTSAANLSAVRSIQEVVLGLRGVVSALGQNAMFSGPLAQLDNAALTALDRRMASPRRRDSSRLTVTAP